MPSLALADWAAEDLFRHAEVEIEGCSGFEPYVSVLDAPMRTEAPEPDGPQDVDWLFRQLAVTRGNPLLKLCPLLT
ncbi:hypothetical protein [Burkholderia sp. Ac-20379]|uniref:hypothetical protein n=1 Tax=Burkholderia sp. Ac-20379 TaxID=2703900 RepID=UPI0030DB0292